MSESSIDNNVKQAFDRLPALIWSSDNNGNCLFVNKSWQNFTGMSLEKAQGKGWVSSIHKDDLKRFRKLSNRRSKKSTNEEFRLMRADGTFAWVVGDFLTKDSVHTGTFTDVSVGVERLQIAEQAEKRTKDFLKSVIEGIPDPIFVKDEKHRWIEGNKAFFDMFSLPREEVLYKSDYEFFPKEEADIFWKKDNEVFESEGVVDNFETFTHDGVTRTLYTRKVVATDPAGKRILIGAIRDITELEKVKGRLEKAVEELSESNEDLERFAYVASHDLQEPLRMVMNFTGLLEENYGDKLDADGLQCIAFASEAAKRMEELVEDLLEYARFNEDVDRKETVNCNNLVFYVKENLHELVEAESASVNIDGNLPILANANPVRLSRVIQNIISNAVKYHRPKVKPEINISCQGVDDFWRFAISDNGIGIEEEFFERVFVPFKRLHTKEEFSGTGIGLAICKKIIDSKGGKIWVESELGKGSVFYFTVPKKEGDKP